MAKGFFRSQVFSNITIISGHEKFVLSAQLDYLVTLCSGSWKVRRVI